MPQTYLAQLNHFADFLLAYTHTLLCLRGLYPRTSFVRARFHNTPVFQSRHPSVCQWVRDAIAAVHTELLAGTVARIGIVIYWYGGVEQGGSAKILERFMLDVSRFPVVDKEERNMQIDWAKSATPGFSDEEGGNRTAESKGKRKALASDAEWETNAGANADAGARAELEADVDMSEQFRAALVMLNSRCSRLKPLPKNCSFNVCMELKDEAEIDPPIGHPQPWIPAQSSLQKTGRKGAEVDEQTKVRRETEGHDLGGAKVTPIRTVEAGVLRFETWIEEGKAKFELDTMPSSGSTGDG
ncbi:DNA-binding protein [Westerdykella ornata]|uniref:DNA-binding protein n=1 Tax=Westerdykella ornata TaxID=318751 RepID=A0A6A6JHJ9_WESOR|nr:DNA-binding protein [Westerdykella ornata]KAF2276031.1 DNA-binding protein [Westerdykella ornata]